MPDFGLPACPCVTLAGNANEQMKVTVTHVTDPVPPTDADTPDSGNRYVGINLTMQNVGNVAYSDAPGNGAQLIDATGQSHQAETTSSESQCDSPATTNIAPGDTQTMCIPFQVSTGTNPDKFQFTLSSGFANATAQWTLAGATTNTGATPAGTVSTATNGALASLPLQCSPGLAATQAASCDLASNVFYEYFKAGQNGGNTSSLSAWSPTTKQYYGASCSSGNGVITCSLSGTSGPNAQVEFTQAAIDAYSPQQASSYASGHEVGPNG